MGAANNIGLNSFELIMWEVYVLDTLKCSTWTLNAEQVRTTHLTQPLIFAYPFHSVAGALVRELMEIFN